MIRSRAARAAALLVACVLSSVGCAPTPPYYQAIIQQDGSTQTTIAIDSADSIWVTEILWDLPEGKETDPWAIHGIAAAGDVAQLAQGFDAFPEPSGPCPQGGSTSFTEFDRVDPGSTHQWCVQQLPSSAALTDATALFNKISPAN